MILKMERWKSSDRKREHHYFLPLGGMAEMYVIGFNPEALSPKARNRIMAIAKRDAEKVMDERKKSRK